MEIESFHLPVSEGHQLHVALWGNRKGQPIVFLHGGPGSGCNSGQRALFNAERDLVIFLDQRGAGQSLPHRARHANTLPHLIEDLEVLRRHLGLEEWMLVGGSWGATLALAYAAQHSQRVKAMVLRAIFLGTRVELDRAFGTTMRRFYPALHDAFLEFLPEDERDAPLDAYWRRILDPDPAVHGPAAWIWHDVERALSTAPGPVPPMPDRRTETRLPSTPFLEAHYFQHDCFLAPGALLTAVPQLARIPAVFVQGRFDLLCPPETSAALAAAWPAARLEMVETAGHGLDHPGIFSAVAAAVSAIVKDLREAP